jgi:HK97 family phage major capsid protein
MTRLKELEVEREDKRDVIKAILAGAAQGKRSLTDAERERISSFTTELEALEGTIKAEHDALEWDRTSAPAVDWPDGETPPAVRATGPGPGGRTYADLFGAPKASPFKSHTDFFAAVHGVAVNGLGNPALVPMAAMGGSVGSEGGFAVPAQLAASWLDVGLESEIVRPRATVYPMTTETIGIPGWDDNSHAAGSIAGFRAHWTAELGALTDSTGSLRKVGMKAEKLTVSTQLSNELLADGGQSFRDQLERKLGGAVSWSLDDKFLTGTGAGQPLGILNDGALISVAKETSQVAATFVLENALKMYERLYPGGYANGVWIINHSVVPQLYTMIVKVKNVAGTENVGGSVVPYFTVGANGQMQLLGLPIVVTEKVPALGTKGDVILADLTQYAIGLRQDILVEASRHAGWSTDSTFYRAIVRVNGLGTWNKVLTPKAGSTRSWVVCCDTR